jgi:hypothetical protein
MPPAQHLTWTRIDKFAGLHDAQTPALIPPNAAQVMSGCHPQPAGGLRAFFKPNPLRGLTQGMSPSGSKFRVMAIHAANVETPGGAYEDIWFCITGAVDTTLAARTKAPRPPVSNVQSYRLNANGSWTQTTSNFSATDLGGISQFNDNGSLWGRMSPGLVPLTPVGLVSRSNYYVMAPGGLHRVTYSGYSRQEPHTPLPPTIIASHQGRLVAGFGSSVVYTTPGLYDLPANYGEQFVNLGESFLNWVIWLAPQPPGDLIVGTLQGAVYVIQGEMDDPIVRTLLPSGSHRFPGGVPALTPIGPVVPTASGPALVSTGGGIRPLGGTLGGKHWYIEQPSGLTKETGRSSFVIANDIAQSNGYIYVRSDLMLQNKVWLHNAKYLADDAPGIDAWVDENILDLNGSLVYDPKTDAWFRSVHPDVCDLLSPVIHTDPGVAGPGGEAFGVITIPSKEFSPNTDDPVAYAQTGFGRRAHTWEWRSAPLHTEDGREFELGEVQLGAYGHEPFEGGTTYSTSTLTAFPGIAPLPASAETSSFVVTARNERGESQDRTLEVKPGVSKVYRAKFRLTGTYIDISVKAASSHPDVEAPTLEYIAFGRTPTGGAAVYQK